MARSTSCKYPLYPPFDPPERFPELTNAFGEVLRTDLSNAVYSVVRESFLLLGYDRENSNTSQWNPLSFLVKSGEVVFVKPNMISERHKLNNDWDYVLTNGSVIRPIIDYLFLAMHGRGRVIIGDAPQTDSRFNEIVRLMGLKEIQTAYRQFKDFEIEIVNLQDEYWIQKDDVIIEKIGLPGDPRGAISFDLGKDSYLSEFDSQGRKYYGAFYDVDETNQHHSNGKHEYLVSRSPIMADVFISVPKLKTHKKCGLTVNLKSLVGINANKNWLPHYAFGSPEEGGDQFPVSQLKGKLENRIVVGVKRELLKKSPFLQFLARKGKRLAYRVFGNTERVVRSGNWYGNDTVWRMALDLNAILMYGEPDGSFRTPTQAKRYLSIVDGIVSMEGNGPVAGTRKETGFILVGESPVATDAACARLMGFDMKKIPLIQDSFRRTRYPLAEFTLDDITIVSNVPTFEKRLTDISNSDSLHFLPHFGWVGHIEAN